jgi:hypothetical protein
MSKDLSINITVHCRDCGEPLTYETVYANDDASVHMNAPTCTLCLKGEFDRGYTMGVEEGEARGYTNGYNDGYDGGYEDGCESCIEFIDDELKEDY